MKKLICALVALVLTASACGGSDEAEGSQVDTDVETTLGGDVEAAEETTTTATTVVEAATDADVDLYCALWVTSEAEGEGFFESPESDIPENVEQFIADQTLYLEQAIGAAPEELKLDLALQRDGIVRIGEILEANDWSLAASIGEMATDSQVNSPEADAASDRLQVFNDENCQAFVPEDDVAVDEPTEDTTDEGETAGDDIDQSDAELLEGLLQTPAGREAFIGELTNGSDVTEEQAGCLVDNLDAGMLVAMNDLDDIDSAGAQAFLELLETCGIPLEAFL